MKRRVPRPHLIDYLFLAILILYALAGLRLAPFHGDESTVIYMSHDWGAFTGQRPISTLFFSETPRYWEDQSLRLQNGVISKYGIGLGWWLIGLSVDNLNAPWAWGRDWQFNADNKILPEPRVWFTARLSASLMLAISIAAVFAIGWRISARGGAWLAALIYATAPAVLLNGRRAVFEGAMLVSLALLILVALSAPRRNTVGNAIWLGLAAGLALASKHTHVITVGAVWLALIWVGRREIVRRAIWLMGTALIAVAIFLALNPAWWPNPLRVGQEVWKLRLDVINLQANALGALPGTPDRLQALIAMPFGAVQFYEDSYGWPEWIAGEITAYQKAGLAGVGWPSWLVGSALIAAIIGIALGNRWREDRVQMILIVLILTVAAIGITNPLPWQRYYLPLTIPGASLIGVGLTDLYSRLRARTIRG